MNPKIINAPDKYTPGTETPIKVFLGGTIAFGKASLWQHKLANDDAFKDQDIVWFNPRREQWDGMDAKEQVEWEIAMQKESHIRVYYFEKGFVSPITLMEVALFANEFTIVCCEEDYMYRENLLVVQSMYNFTLVHEWKELVAKLTSLIKSRNEELACTVM